MLSELTGGRGSGLFMCVHWLADGFLEGLCIPSACWACCGLQASGSAWFLLCLPRLFARCLALEGLSRSELSCLRWDAEVVEVFSSRRGPDSPLFHCLSLRWFRSHVVVLGIGPQLGQAAVLHAFSWCSVAALSRSSGEELSAGWVAEATVALCVVSSSESECCEYISH
ncbi:hypothetical protein Taro_010413 [Colocasia esculenta]|uniref:Uncharacterized protein n=1 Tax=Colocasia esculenta TaxID=4460 RepID=A0A843U7K5_COLES|nr:hypothetical protein [Colocasia esculenta]